MLRFLLIATLFALAWPDHAWSFGSVACGFNQAVGRLQCLHTINENDTATSGAKALEACGVFPLVDCRIYLNFGGVDPGKDQCAVVLIPPPNVQSNPPGLKLAAGVGTTVPAATEAANARAFTQWPPVTEFQIDVSDCDYSASNRTAPKALRTGRVMAPASSKSDTSTATPPYANPDFYGALGRGLFLHDLREGLIIGLLLSVFIVAFAKRAPIIDYIANGNLPHQLSNYGDDIEVLFTRTQRVNWYGRTVFGVVARLGVTEHQLKLVRKYWLGRVLAFDSFRRYQQNQLARMHVQLAAAELVMARAGTAQSFWSALKRVFFFFFYFFRALASFLFGFLFIRVTIAALIRGKLVESKDLVLLLEAKEAIEETAGYLKSYLTVAETFDGQEELFEPEGPIDAVLEAIYGRRKAQPQSNPIPLRRSRETVSS